MDQVEMVVREPFQIFPAHHFNMVAVAHRWDLGHHPFTAQPLVAAAFPRLTARM
jgi:hypothetical protein